MGRRENCAVAVALTHLSMITVTPFKAKELQGRRRGVADFVLTLVRRLRFPSLRPCVFAFKKCRRIFGWAQLATPMV